MYFNHLWLLSLFGLLPIAYWLAVLDRRWPEIVIPSAIPWDGLAVDAEAGAGSGWRWPRMGFWLVAVGLAAMILGAADPNLEQEVPAAQVVVVLDERPPMETLLAPASQRRRLDEAEEWLAQLRDALSGSPGPTVLRPSAKAEELALASRGPDRRVVLLTWQAVKLDGVEVVAFGDPSHNAGIVAAEATGKGLFLMVENASSQTRIGQITLPDGARPIRLEPGQRLPLLAPPTPDNAPFEVTIAWEGFDDLPRDDRILFGPPAVALPAVLIGETPDALSKGLRAAGFAVIHQAGEDPEHPLVMQVTLPQCQLQVDFTAPPGEAALMEPVLSPNPIWGWIGHQEVAHPPPAPAPPGMQPALQLEGQTAVGWRSDGTAWQVWVGLDPRGKSWIGSRSYPVFWSELAQWLRARGGGGEGIRRVTPIPGPKVTRNGGARAWIPPEGPAETTRTGVSLRPWLLLLAGLALVAGWWLWGRAARPGAGGQGAGR